MTSQGHEQFSRVGDEKMHKNTSTRTIYIMYKKNFPIYTYMCTLRVYVIVCQALKNPLTIAACENAGKKLNKPEDLII